MLITTTASYVAWVEADDAEQAHDLADQATYDWIEGLKPIDGEWPTVEKPDETRHFMHTYAADMPDQDAHVHTHNVQMLLASGEEPF